MTSLVDFFLAAVSFRLPPVQMCSDMSMCSDVNCLRHSTQLWVQAISGSLWLLRAHGRTCNSKPSMAILSPKSFVQVAFITEVCPHAARIQMASRLTMQGLRQPAGLEPEYGHLLWL